MFWNLNERFFYILATCERLPVPDYFLSGHKTSICTWICRLHPLLEVDFCSDQHSTSVPKRLFFSHLHLDIFERRLHVYSGNVLRHLTFCCLLVSHYIHTGKPVSSAVKANESAHVALNVLFSSDTFRILHSWPTWVLCAGGSCTLAVVTHIKGDNFF